MNPQFVPMVPQVVSWNLKLYVQLTVFLLLGTRTQCSLTYPRLGGFFEGDLGDYFEPRCYSYWCDTAIQPLTYEDIPDHAMCRLWCGGQQGANLAGLRDGKNCSCYSREEFHFIVNFRRDFECDYKCGPRKSQPCGGYRTTYLMTPIYPELPNCFSGIGEPGNKATLGEYAYLNHKSNTPKRCQEACSKMEYPFAAVFRMYNCWCLPSPFGFQLMPKLFCNMPCPGSLFEKCGGIFFAWVMKSAPVEDVTCIKDQRGVNFRGKLSVTGEFQQPCAPWSRRMEIIRTYSRGFIRQYGFFQRWLDGYEKMKPEERNSTYCRNIDNDENGPWCFASIKYHGTLKRHCYIPICPTEVIKSRPNEPCAMDKDGRDYIGLNSTTRRGERCMSWSHPDVVIKLHDTSIGEAGFNYMPMQAKRSNLCRNNDYRPNGPWCFIEGRFPAWDYCGIELCNKKKKPGCKVDVKGIKYYGEVDHAKTGQRCRVWDSLEVQKHMSKRKRLIRSFKGWSRKVQLSNYCRNPDYSEVGPWCYIEDENVPSWRVCDIEMCDETILGCKNDVKGLDYNGKGNYANTGQSCRIWDTDDVVNYMIKKRRLFASYMNWPRNVQRSNFCRNPDHWEGGPWCFIEDEPVPSWRACDIKLCNDTDQTAAFGGVSHGDHLWPSTLPVYILAGIVMYGKLSYE